MMDEKELKKLLEKVIEQCIGKEYCYIANSKKLIKWINWR